MRCVLQDLIREQARSCRRPDPAVFRVILILVLVLSLAGLAWIAAEWAQRNFVPSPKPIVPPENAFIQHPGYESLATRAVDDFADLPEPRRRQLLDNLRANLGELDAGIAGLASKPFTILCLGERHAATTRRFVATALIPTLAVDVLLLEAPDEEMSTILDRVDAGLPQVPLLGEDIAAVIRAARRANPNVVVAGIDESVAQKSQRVHRGKGSRDRAITSNLRSHLRKRKRHAVLFGALHCADQPNWLYRRIILGEHRVTRKRIRNVNLIGEHQDGTLEAFLEFIRVIGVARRNFMLTDTRALDPLIYSWFPGLTRSFLRFDSVIVFQEHSHAHFPSTHGRLDGCTEIRGTCLSEKSPAPLQSGRHRMGVWTGSVQSKPSHV